MSTTTSYNEFILESVIRQILDSGEIPTTELIESMYDSFVLDKDLTQPLFDNVAANVVLEEHASASKYNNTNYEIWRDLQIAYTSTFDSTNQAIQAFDRWRSEVLALEAKLRSLDTRLADLIKTQLHLGSHYISEVFSDTSKVDLSNSTAYINLKDNNVSLNVSDNKPNRINLNYIKSDNITFTVLSRLGLENVTDAPGTELKNIFDDKDNFWQSRVSVSNAKQPISAELKVKLNDTPISISKITCALHSANTNSAMQITPLLSVDGVNFTQLSTNNITISVTDSGSWNFPSTDATHIKFIMTKNGFDFNQEGSYIYEFGFKEIAIFDQAYDADISQTLVSTSLYVPDINKNPFPYFSASLETCDDIPDDTNIQYYLAALEEADDSPTWVAVSSTNNPSALHPTQINFGDKQDVTLDNVSISFNGSEAAGFINPARAFNITTLISGAVSNSVFTATANRYVLSNSNDRLLNYEIDGSLDIVDGSIEIFRNRGTRGDTTKVRGIQNGWSFSDPYYVTAIEIQNPNGRSIKFGERTIIIDDASTSGIVNLTTGVHIIKVHKNNWISVASGASTLATLKAADPLFPFNHKLLIEGYSLSDPQNPYLGVDIYAGYYMKQVPIVDFIHTIDKLDYSKFGIDTDAIIPDKEIPSTVFVVKSDENSSDFLDEKFTIRFDVQNQFYNYVKLKAVLSTSSSTVSPILQSYKIKLSS